MGGVKMLGGMSALCATPSRLRILCMIPAMGPGGAERVMSRLVAYLGQRHEVVLLTWEKPGTSPFYPLPETVHLAQRGQLGGWGPVRLWHIMRRFATVRAEVGPPTPDVVLSFMDT